jgi:hypothetical protein
MVMISFDPTKIHLIELRRNKEIAQMDKRPGELQAWHPEIF